jgi:hypothetical protein
MKTQAKTKQKQKQSYGTKSYLKLILNKLKAMKGPTFTYTPLGTLLLGNFHGGFHVPINQGSFLISFMTTN